MDEDRRRGMLNAMDEQISHLISIADELQDHMLAAVLCQARDRVADAYRSISTR